MCRLDPLLFGLIYLPHHLKDESGNFSLSPFHEALINYAKTWPLGLKGPQELRDAFIAPRESGKSTWLFTILPMWAGAYGYHKFIAAFSDRAAQAQGHLLTFKQELDGNKYLNSDFPALCRPKQVEATGRPVAQNAWKIFQDNGFVFAASGIDVSNHGIKVGAKRPDLLICDDIEPGEKNYSDHGVKQTKIALFDDIAPMNIKARMMIVGTTTMPNSLIDQLRKYNELPEHMDTPSDLAWIDDQKIKVHYYPAIMQNDDGTESSLWPEKWSLEWLQSVRHTRDFAKNYMNRPISTTGVFWNDEDILKGTSEYGNTILSVDPSVTKNKLSDYTGLAVLSRGTDDKIYVRKAIQVKLSPADLAKKVTEMVEEFGVGVIYVETNQGGDLWKEVLKDVPCKYRSVRQTESKNIRAGKALNFYQQGKVIHDGDFPVLLEQMFAFPKVAHDDVLDAVVSGVLYFLGKPRIKVEATQMQYI